MSDAGDTNDWHPWRVAPRSGFVVNHPSGSVGVVQQDAKQFLVLNRFRFDDVDIEQLLHDELVANGMTDAEATKAVDDARTFTPDDENPTDLASIPRFMRWFENPYGVHTLAALIHDNLIVTEANGGVLRSDTLSDRFFRLMMGASGVPYLKRWIMWAAVAMRSRWAADWPRRLSLIAWLACALVGIASSFGVIAAVVSDWSPPLDTGLLAVIAVVLPFVSAPLWGKQYGASLVAAVAAFWVAPAALVAFLGYAVYLLLEFLAGKAGFD